MACRPSPSVTAPTARRSPRSHLRAGARRARLAPRPAQVARGGAGPPTRGVADRRMARRQGRADRLLDLEPPCRHRARAARATRTHALEDGARLQAAQRRARPGPLRGPLLARLVPPHGVGERRPRVPHARAAKPFSPAAGLTLPKAVLLMQPIFKC